MKILLTGGAGYKGSLLCGLLLEDGHEVTILDTFIWGINPILHFVHHPKLNLIKKDVAAVEVGALIPEYDVIIHLAAIVGFPACVADPDRAYEVNLYATERIAKKVSRSQIFIFASTGSTYGMVKGICTEDTPVNPLSVYGVTKHEAEKRCQDSGAILLRFATVFGVSSRLRLDLLVNDFCFQAVHNRQIILFEGHHRRTFLHVRDAVESYRFSLAHAEKMKGQFFNIGNHHLNYTKREIAEEIQKKHPYYLHEADVGLDADQRNYEVSYEKISNLGFQPKYSLEEGIDELLKVVPHIKLTNPYRNI